jgi:hypothetical protein
MKRIVSVFFLILPALITNSCLNSNDNCIVCEINDYYGSFKEYYGSECGNALRTSKFENDAEEYAEEYYDGYANCYYEE